MGVLSNPKHEKFCQEYIRNGNSAYRAYIKAGYEEKAARECASRLLTKANIQARLTEIRREIRAGDLVTVAEVIENFKRIAKKAEDEGDNSTARGCWQDLGKTIAAFTDNISIDGNINNILTFEEVAQKKAK